MKHVKITCDQCNSPLEVTGAMPAYRIAMHCEKIPSDSDIQYSVLVEPAFYGEKHFCGLNCLWEWMEKKNRV